MAIVLNLLISAIVLLQFGDASYPDYKLRPQPEKVIVRDQHRTVVVDDGLGPVYRRPLGATYRRRSLLHGPTCTCNACVTRRRLVIQEQTRTYPNAKYAKPIARVAKRPVYRQVLGLAPAQLVVPATVVVVANKPLAYGGLLGGYLRGGYLGGLSSVGSAYGNALGTVGLGGVIVQSAAAVPLYTQAVVQQVVVPAKPAKRVVRRVAYDSYK